MARTAASFRAERKLVNRGQGNRNGQPTPLYGLARLSRVASPHSHLPVPRPLLTSWPCTRCRHAFGALEVPTGWIRGVPPRGAKTGQQGAGKPEWSTDSVVRVASVTACCVTWFRVPRPRFANRPLAVARFPARRHTSEIIRQGSLLTPPLRAGRHAARPPDDHRPAAGAPSVAVPSRQKRGSGGRSGEAGEGWSRLGARRPPALPPRP